MAYGLRYQSDFYNYFDKLVSLKIYKKDYTDSVEDDIRLQELVIESNYIDDNTPIIGKGLKVVIIADSDDLGYLNDLLISYERQFLATVEYDGTVVFRGYTLYDLNERQLLPYAAVTVQFTDYLHRTEGRYSSSLNNIGSFTNLMAIVNSLFIETDLELPIYVNSTLFEDSMSNGVTDTWLPQTCVQNSNFYKDSYNYDNIYEMVNKALHSFSAFVYSYNDKWVIERQEDITRTGDWVAYSDDIEDSGYDSSGAIPDGSVVASLKQEYNKQDGDFEYVNTSQVIVYDTGLNTLILRLRDKKVDTLIFNNYTANMLSVSDETPESGTLDRNVWYKHDNLPDPIIGENYESIVSWVKFLSDTSTHGLYYNFIVQFNGFTDMESSGASIDNHTILDINYTMSTDQSTSTWKKVKVRFLLRLDGGEYDGWYLQYAIPLGGDPTLYLWPDAGIYQASNPEVYYTNYATLDVEAGNVTWPISISFNLTDKKVRNMLINQFYDNLWDLLDYAKYQRFTIMFLPLWFTTDENEMFPSSLVAVNYLGDITARINVEDIANKITYVLNQDFIKTDEVDLYLFDLDNFNYSNGLLEEDGETLTNLWTSEDSTDPIPLYEVFAKCKFRKYGRTIHRLKATILTDNILKPFSILTDDNLTYESGGTIVFLLNGFTWDLNAGTYDIEAEEYTEEEVTVEGVAYDENGNQIEPDIGVPTLTLVRLQHASHPIVASWTLVWGGVSGYIVERKPYYSAVVGNFVDSWKLIYVDSGNYCIDSVTNGVPTGLRGPREYTYRVMAYSGVTPGTWSDEKVIYWYP